MNKKENLRAEPYILFELAGTTYGLPSRFVQQMEMVENLTPVPNAPVYVDGVMFSRGQVIPAVNLRLRFGFEKVPYDLRTRVVRVVGLIVDTAREYISLPADAVQPPPESITGLSGRYLEGIAKIGERIILIFNVTEILKFDEIQDLIKETVNNEIK
jgi:purine-binding chemotaxis protein CheW